VDTTHTFSRKAENPLFDEFWPNMQITTVWFAAQPDDAPPLTANTSRRRQPRRLKPCAIDPQQSAR